MQLIKSNRLIALDSVVSHLETMFPSSKGDDSVSLTISEGGYHFNYWNKADWLAVSLRPSDGRNGRSLVAEFTTHDTETPAIIMVEEAEDAVVVARAIVNWFTEEGYLFKVKRNGMIPEYHIDRKDNKIQLSVAL